jgi:hypothetical protein
LLLIATLASIRPEPLMKLETSFSTVPGHTRYQQQHALLLLKKRGVFFVKSSPDHSR